MKIPGDNVLTYLFYLSIIVGLFTRPASEMQVKPPHYFKVLIFTLLLLKAAQLVLPKKRCGLPNTLSLVVLTFLLFVYLPNLSFFTITVIIGVVFNALAVAANGGFMPVDKALYRRKIGVKNDISDDKIHVLATNKTRVRFLIDRFGHPLLFAGVGSIGDILIYGSIVIFVTYKLLIR